MTRYLVNGNFAGTIYDELFRHWHLKRNSIFPFGSERVNKLPKNIRQIKSNLEMFKKVLDRSLSTIPDEPLIPG